MSSSVSPSARVSRALLAALALLAAGAAFAQPMGEAAPRETVARIGVIVVDWRRALAESEIGRSLDALEIEERRAARAELDSLKAELEAEESALAALRDELGRDGADRDDPARAEFDARVRAFDQRVRRARRSAQEISASLQSRFSAARSALDDVARPILEALMREFDVEVALDADRVLLATPALDATQALISRLDASYSAQSAATLLPRRAGATGDATGP